MQIETDTISDPRECFPMFPWLTQFARTTLKAKMEIDLHIMCLMLQQENELSMDSPATCVE